MILAVFFMDKINGFMTLLNSGMLNRSQGDLLHGSERNIVESADGIIEWNFISQFCDRIHNTQCSHIIITDKCGGGSTILQCFDGSVIAVLIFGLDRPDILRIPFLM